MLHFAKKNLSLSESNWEHALYLIRDKGLHEWRNYTPRLPKLDLKLIWFTGVLSLGWQWCYFSSFIKLLFLQKHLVFKLLLVQVLNIMILFLKWHFFREKVTIGWIHAELYYYSIGWLKLTIIVLKYIHFGRLWIKIVHLP